MAVTDKMTQMIKRTGRSFKQTMRLIAKDKKGTVGLIITLMFVLMATIGPVILPYDDTWNLENMRAPPSWEHPLGFDKFGRDQFRMLIAGARPVLSVSVMAAFIIITIGITVGMISGFAGGKIDTVLMFATDIALTLPGLVLITVIAAYIRSIRDPVTLALILSITAWAGLARAIRSQVLALKERGFVEAAQTLGLKRTHTIFRELLPNLMSYVAISFFWSVLGTISAAVGIFYLGLVPFEETNWGVMLSRTMSHPGTFLTTFGKVGLLAPLLTLMLLQTGFIFLASGMETVFNPRLRED